MFFLRRLELNYTVLRDFVPSQYPKKRLKITSILIVNLFGNKVYFKSSLDLISLYQGRIS